MAEENFEGKRGSQKALAARMRLTCWRVLSLNWSPTSDEGDDQADGAQGDFDAGGPADAAEGGIGGEPAVDGGFDGSKAALVTSQQQMGGERWQDLQPVDLPDIFDVAAAAVMAKIDVEGIGFGVGPGRAGDRIEAPEAGGEKIGGIALGPGATEGGEMTGQGVFGCSGDGLALRRSGGAGWCREAEAGRGADRAAG